MTLKGETIATGAQPFCVGGDGIPDHERIDMVPEVLMSGGGFYIGTRCPYCGPYSRESSYYSSREDADHALASGDYGRP